MNILHIVNGYVGNRVYKGFFEHLKSFGILQTLFIPIRNPSQEGINESELPEIRTYYRVVVNSVIYRLFFHLKIRKELFEVKSLINIQDYNIIHAHTLFSDGAVAYELFRHYKIPYIVAIRNTDINVFCKYFLHLRNLGKEIIINAAKLIFLSEAYKAKLIFYYGSIARLIELKSAVIPNGIDDFWYAQKSQIKPFNKDVKLVFAGELRYNKNIHGIIKAIDKMPLGFIPELTIIGAGLNDQKLYYKWLKFLIHNKPNIKILKAMPKDDLALFYKNSTIFVMPSFKESFGLVYAEAISQNLPVIYTRGEGFDGWFYQGEVGYSIDPDSPADIAEKILLTIQNYDEIQRRIASKGSLFSWEVICEKYYHIYCNISLNDKTNL